MSEDRVAVVTLPSPPSANRYWRKVRNRMILSTEALAYRAAVVAAWTQQVGWPGTDESEVLVTVRWYRPARRGDLDNHLKIVLDALQYLAYGNDGCIKRLVAERFDDKANPRLEVEIVRL